MTKSDVLAAIDARQEESSRRVREVIERENPDYLPTHDAGMEEIASGRHSLRMLWGSISPAQQRLLKTLSDGPRKLVRARGTSHFYDVVGEPHAASRAARTATVKALVARNLLRYEGSRDDEHFTAMLAERGYSLLALIKSQN